MEEGGLADSSELTLSAHTGTHLDAPAHYLPGGRPVDQLNLWVLVGPAELITVTSHAGVIGRSHLDAVLANRPRRLLIRANAPTELAEFPREFVSLSPEAAEAIVESGVQLVGIDAPSVDSFDSRELPVHRILGRRGVIIVENLRFGDIPDGQYLLVALPLKIEGGDGSPIRAVLISPAASVSDGKEGQLR